MAKVGILMGSDSDLPIMSKAAKTLEQFGVEYEMTIISAHRMPDIFVDYAKTAKERGIKVIIAGAAALFPMPVIGVPIMTQGLGGLDSLYSIVQMPSGIPVATVSINGSVNAALLAVKMLSMSDDSLVEKLAAYSVDMKDAVSAKAEKLDKLGYEEYIKQM